MELGSEVRRVRPWIGASSFSLSNGRRQEDAVVMVWRTLEEVVLASPTYMVYGTFSRWTTAQKKRPVFLIPF